MDIDFSLVLVVLVAVAAVAWLVDWLLLSRPRLVRQEEFLKASAVERSEFEQWLEADGGQEQALDPGRKKVMEQAYEIGRESAPVEYAKSFLPVLLVVLIIRSFLFEPFQIPTGSMIPTLKIGDFIVVNKYAYGVRLPVIGTKILDVGEPQRGDVMVFIPPHVDTYYIKRVIGLPGDHVRYDVNEKQLYINGEPAAQEFVAMLRNENPPVVYLKEQLGEVNHDIHTFTGLRYPNSNDWLSDPEGRVIPEGHYFMMGDNRDNSEDSRVWGPVSEDNIVGKAVAVWMHKEPGLNLPSFSDNRFINH